MSARDAEAAAVLEAVRAAGETGINMPGLLLALGYGAVNRLSSKGMRAQRDVYFEIRQLELSGDIERFTLKKDKPWIAWRVPA